jgi:hypothetical protein
MTNKNITRKAEHKLDMMMMMFTLKKLQRGVSQNLILHRYANQTKALESEHTNNTR